MADPADMSLFHFEHETNDKTREDSDDDNTIDVEEVISAVN